MNCVKCAHDTTVLETRSVEGGFVMRRRRACQDCGHIFNTYEVDETIWPTVRKWALDNHIKALHKKHALTARNQQICAMATQGHKHAYIAAQFGLSDNMVSHILTKAGITSFKKRNARTKEVTLR